MRILILLLVSSLCYGQGIGKLDGNISRYNGLTGRVQADDIPPPSGQSDDNYVIHYSNDFEQWATESEYAEDSIESDFTTNGFVSCTNNLSILNWNSLDNVLLSYYKEDHMGNCASGDWQATTDPPTRGTGGNFGYYFMGDYSGFDSIIMTYSYCFSDPFDIGQGGWVEMKLPGMRADGGSQMTSAVIRMLMNGDWSGNNHHYFRWYIQREGQDDEPNEDSQIIGTTDDTITPGECVTISILLGMNTGGSANGLAALYLNENLIGYTDTITWSHSGTIQWDRIEWSTFIGGSDDELMTPLQDQYTAFDDVVFWMDLNLSFNKNDGSTLPATITLPPEANYPQTYHGSLANIEIEPEFPTIEIFASSTLDLMRAEYYLENPDIPIYRGP